MSNSLPRLWQLLGALALLPIATPAFAGVLHPHLSQALVGQADPSLVRDEITGAYRVYVLLDDAAGKSPGRAPSDPERTALTVRRVERWLGTLPAPLHTRVLRTYEGLPIVSMALPADRLREVATLAGVRIVEPWVRYSPQWAQARALMGLNDIGPTGADGRGVVLGLIDSTVDALHPLLGGAPYDGDDPDGDDNDKLIGGWDFSRGDGNGDNDPTVNDNANGCVSGSLAHGTIVSSFAVGAAAQVEGQALQGLLSEAKLVFVKLYDEDACEAQVAGDMVAAVNWLRTQRDALGIDVISTSLAASTAGEPVLFPSVAECEATFPSVAAAFQAAHDDGLTAFASAGNFGTFSKDAIAAPACLPAVISVGAVYDAPYTEDPDNPDVCPPNLTETNVPADWVARFSSSAEFLDLLAPGIFITAGTTDYDSPVPHDRTVLRCAAGTSLAAPAAAAVAALLAHRAGEQPLTPDELFELLRLTGVSLTDMAVGRVTPRVDASAAVARLDGLVDADLDGLSNEADNCLFAANADQRDTNGDGYGNLCDADLNDDGIVNNIDLSLMRAVFFTDDADADLNGDGIVNTVDLGLMAAAFFNPPGPSGTL